jgi:hypothetical protein
VITLNSEQGLTIVENWEDVEGLPGFVPDLNPAEHQLDSIIGRYVFSDKRRCGLSNCHTPHSRGYIVTTKQGSKTNIGKDCGKRYFGVDFETMSKKFERDVTEKENRIRLNSFSFQIDDLEARIADLRQRPRGANWVYHNIQPLLVTGKGCPNEVVRKIASMVRNGSSGLEVEREATQSEIQSLEATQGGRVQRPYIITEKIADVDGFQSLYKEYDLKDLLVVDLEENLKVFKEKDIDCLSFEDLRYWVKWADSVERTIEKAERAIKLGNRLLNKATLEPFCKILTAHEDTIQFKAYLKKLQ